MALFRQIWSYLYSKLILNVPVNLYSELAAARRQTQPFFGSPNANQVHLSAIQQSAYEKSESYANSENRRSDRE
jgi:hypothetical protein